jgi:hypothetical protein
MTLCTYIEVKKTPIHESHLCMVFLYAKPYNKKVKTWLQLNTTTS